MKGAASGTDLVVFPGVEISTRDGHLLALLDPTKNGEAVHELLIECGIKNGFGDEDTVCLFPIEKVAQIVQSCEGIAVAAHFDGPKGFMTTVGVGQARIRIFDSNNIEGVELLDATTKNDWVAGRHWKKSRACVQGSDAHAIAEIGRRTTWLRVGKLNIQGLRLALGDPKVRIRFPEEYDLIRPAGYVESMRISQGFFEGLNLKFNPGLNCIIGGQGSGKSAILEFLRFGLGNISEVKTIKDDNAGKLNSLLRPGGTVTITLRTAKGIRLNVTRTYDGDKNPVRIEQLLSNGTSRPYTSTSLSEEFPLLAYSQNEGLNISRDVERQLELIDKHIDLRKTGS